MDGKKQKRPDMQIYRPPRSKDRQNEDEPVKVVNEAPRRMESNKKEERRTLETSQNQQQVRSRVFRRRAARDGDMIEEEAGTPRTFHRQQEVTEEEGRMSSFDKTIEEKDSYREDDRKSNNQQRRQRVKTAPVVSIDKEKEDRGRGRGKVNKGPGRGYSARQQFSEFQDVPKNEKANGPRRGGNQAAFYDRNDMGNDLFYPSQPDRKITDIWEDEFFDMSESRKGDEYWQRDNRGRGRGGRGAMRGRGGGRGVGEKDQWKGEKYSKGESDRGRTKKGKAVEERDEVRRHVGREEVSGKGRSRGDSRDAGIENRVKSKSEEKMVMFENKKHVGDSDGRSGRRNLNNDIYGVNEIDYGQNDGGKKGKGNSKTERGNKGRKMEDVSNAPGNDPRRGKNAERAYEYSDNSHHNQDKGRGPHRFEEHFSPTSPRPNSSREGNASYRGYPGGKRSAEPVSEKSREEKRSPTKEERKHGRDYRQQRAEGRIGVSRRTISGSSNRSTLEEEFSEDQRLFNPYSSSSTVPIPSSPSTTSTAANESQRSRPHASGILRLPANLSISSAPPVDRPVMVVRPNHIGGPGNIPRVPGPGILHLPSSVIPTGEMEMWGQRPGEAFYPSQPSQMECVWKDICDLDQDLSAMLTRHMPQVSLSREALAERDWWRQVSRLRHSLMDRHATLLMADLELCNHRQSEQALWKSAFYAVIDPLKKFLDMERRPDLMEVALQVIAEGDSFFKSCVDKLEERYHVQIKSVWNNGYLPPETCNSRSSCLAFLSAQKLLLFLGDLSRYRELVNISNDYGMARTWYIRAQQLAPKNGRPYHQLAVLAMYTKRQMDAMYFYMRSLACGNPFTSASQALSALFDEVRRKVREASRAAEIASRADAERGAGASTGGRQAVRLEIWIHPADGRRTKNRIDDGAEEKAEEDLQLLSFVELNKRFCLSFMHCHGMLFTRIGMESFPERCAQLLKEFSGLLQHSPCAFSERQLLQLTFINIFNVARANSITLHDTSHTCMRSVLFEQATRLGMDMFALLVERASQLMEKIDMDEDCEPRLNDLPSDLRPLLSALCLWTDWMVVHPQDWRPPPSLLDPHLNSPAPDEWQILAHLSTLIDRLLNITADIPNVCSSSESRKLSGERTGSVVLSEERMSAGFKPMVNMEPQLYLYEYQDDIDEEIICDYLRLDKLSMFAEYLCGMQTPYFEFDVNDRKYRSLVPSLASEKSSEGENVAHEHRESEESFTSEQPMSPSADGGREEGCELDDLRRRKLDLEKQLKEQEDREALVRSALAEGSQRMIELEIVPVFVLPDTNCYIDYLSDIRLLVQSKMFTIVLPIIVLNELDGLCRADDGSEQTRQIAVSARKSVQMLEEEFEKRNSHLKAVTSKGTQLETIAFRSETIQQEGNNDDVILACCLHFCVDKARDFMPRSKDEPYHLHREVVLLTSDRNLRLKALGSNIPARPLPRFMAWAYP